MYYENNICKLLKKRVISFFFLNSFNLRKYEIKYSLYISTGKFRTAKSASNFFARKTKMRFSIWESIKPYIRKSRRYLHGLFIGCYGRYRKKTRVKETVIKKGSVPFSSFSANIDFGKSTVRTKFGIANFKVWMAYSTRTREDMLRHFKKVNYIYIRRLNYSLKTKPTLRYFSSFLLPSIKKKEQIIIHAHTHDVKLKIYPRNFDRYLTWLRKFKSKMCINLKKKIKYQILKTKTKKFKPKRFASFTNNRLIITPIKANKVMKIKKYKKKKRKKFRLTKRQKNKAYF